MFVLVLRQIKKVGFKKVQVEPSTNVFTFIMIVLYVKRVLITRSQKQNIKTHYSIQSIQSLVASKLFSTIQIRYA